MRRFFVVVLIFSLGSFTLAGAGAKKEIETKTQELKELQRALKEKRNEKERCLLDEKCIRAELVKIEKAYGRLQKEREKLRRGIITAERKLMIASRDLASARIERRLRSVELNGGVDGYNRRFNTFSQLFSDPVSEKLSFDTLRRQYGSLTAAQEKEVVSRHAQERWQAADAVLLALKARQETMAAEQESLRTQKQALLKTTIGRRIVSEEEIKKIQESSKALQQLIVNLEQSRRKSEDESGRKKKIQGRKHFLAWPVSGRITTRFGKSKNAELDTIVISNGVKITAKPGSAVTAVEHGLVMFAGEFRSYGLMVIIDHGGGFCSIYGQLGSVSVEEDQKISEGAPVGAIARKGQPVLYFEIRSEGQAEDPLLWLEEKQQ
ncbi:MAG: peptidoglycan DD-metalloendopeptidase family protein [Elusimicrobia bacterium]|nr:peptidoglycan DD-metalloendopeptidase family protein [Elusimicrobiota bacterium]